MGVRVLHVDEGKWVDGLDDEELSLGTPVLRYTAADDESRVFICNDGPHRRGGPKARKCLSEAALGGAAEVQNAATSDVEAVPRAKQSGISWANP